jgi:DNA mismatch repair protein MutL
MAVMKAKVKAAPVRALPEEVANKIAAGEVVERPASVVKELVENALDAGATRIAVRLVAAGRRLIEVQDNGHGMSEQDALLAVERHTTSKIRTSEDLDNILTYGFRGEALASIASVSRFELVTRRERDEAATRLRIEGAVLRDVSQTAAPVGTRISVNRLYFNTPVRAKFLKGITTELGRCIDTVQRFALVAPGVAFQLEHNDKSLLDIPANASIRDRIALIWGLGFLNDLIELDTELGGMRFRGFIGTPQLSRSSRSHQFFFMNARPVINRALQYGFEEGYHQLLTVGRRPVGILLVEAPPRSVDINIHPAKREIRFRDERAARKAMSDAVRQRLAELRASQRPAVPPPAEPAAEPAAQTEPWPAHEPRRDAPETSFRPPAPQPAPVPAPTGVQTEFVASRREAREREDFEPTAVYHTVDELGAPIQVFDSYLMVPEEDRLLIIDQHALHERLTYDGLRAELADGDYESQQLMVPLVIDVPPAYVKIIESNLGLFSKLGIEIEPFGGNTFQVTALCHLYEESKISDAVSGVLDQLAQGDLFNEEQFLDDMLRLVVAACRGSVKAGDRLSSEERASLLDGFRRLRPPYTCPHGRPIITELTLAQMEKSFRRRQ